MGGMGGVGRSVGRLVGAEVKVHLFVEENGRRNLEGFQIFPTTRILIITTTM